MVSIGSVDYESFKVQLANTFNLGSHLEVGIEIVANAILTFKKAYFGIEMWPDSSMVAKQF
jgi:hypothetical protein